ncbi:MAG: 50S ribosomal protein L37ae [Nanoarchaeota archaeon]
MVIKPKSIKRFGARYGRTVKDKFGRVELKQRVKQKCPLCGKIGVKRLSKGLWKCGKCGKKFASHVYYLD